MKIVSLTMVGDESEIIESFIRYNLIFLDEMIFVSNCTVDNTTVIIRKLQLEGLPIRLIEEPHIGYEQKYFDYKYMNQIVNDSDADWFISIDADEFLTGEKNPRSIIEELSTDRVYEVRWQNYVMTETDDFDESFIPLRQKYIKENYEGDEITKVILPVKLIRSKNIVMETGHHHVYGENVQVESLDSIKFAHYPAISVDQYLSKLYGNRMKFIAWTNRGNREGIHQNKQICELESGKDIFRVAQGYGLSVKNEAVLKYKPLSLQYCEKKDIEIKYDDLAKTDFKRNINNVGCLMALKAYKLELDTKLNNNFKNVLVFGAGASANKLFAGLPKDIVNIIAYIDNDTSKTFTMYENRLVVSPKWVRYFSFDKVVIANSKYYSEMCEQLIQLGVVKEKIAGAKYLMELVAKSSQIFD